MTLFELRLGAKWLLEELIDWVETTVEKYSYRPRHRGVYNWDIGYDHSKWVFDPFVPNPVTAEVVGQIPVREYLVED